MYYIEKINTPLNFRYLYYCGGITEARKRIRLLHYNGYVFYGIEREGMGSKVGYIISMRKV